MLALILVTFSLSLATLPMECNRMIRINESTVVGDDGLHATIAEMHRDGFRLTLTYILFNHQQGNIVLVPRKVGVVNCLFWDRNNNPIQDAVSASFYYDENFIAGRQSLCIIPICVDMPQDAKYIAIQLGRDSLVTRPIPIP
jgi:hypothetical protein